MVDLKHDDLSGRFVDSVEDTKGASPRRPHALELVAELTPESMRVLDERARDQVDDRNGDGLGELI